MASSVEEFVQDFHYPLLRFPLLLFFFLSTALCFPVSSPHAHTHLNFLFFSLQRCYRVVSITADHQSGGSAGHFRSRRAAS